MKKILIVYATAGEGHKRAALALKDAMGALNPSDVQVQTVDSLDYTNKFFKWFYPNCYIFMVTRIPTIWGLFYYMLDFKWLYPLTSLVRRIINKANTGRFEKFIREYNPDLVISTHFLAGEVISSLKRRRAIKTWLITCVTDFRMHSFWYSGQTDMFCAGFAETKSDLTRKWKVAPDRVHVTGIPIHGKFYAIKNKYEICGRRGLEKDLFTVLITGGGFGVGPIIGLVKNIVELGLRIQVLIVCGHNKKLLDEISALTTNNQQGRSLPSPAAGKQRRAKPPQGGLTTILKPFGFIDYVDELMEVSDLGITKAGGLICSESVAKGLPLIIIAPIPGQESRNCRMLLKNRAAFKIKRPRELKKIISTVYRNTEILKEMRVSIRSVKMENPAMHIAKFVLKVVK